MLKTMANRMARSYNKTGDQEEVFIDPASLVVYATIIMEVIKIAKRCREAQSVPTSAQQPTRFEQQVVKRVVRRKLGFRTYLKEGQEMTKSLFEVGAGSTPEEITELYREV